MTTRREYYPSQVLSPEQRLSAEQVAERKFYVAAIYEDERLDRLVVHGPGRVDDVVYPRPTHDPGRVQELLPRHRQRYPDQGFTVRVEQEPVEGGALQRSYRYGPDGRWLWQQIDHLDGEGYPQLEVMSEPDGRELSRTIHTYDESGELVRTVEQRPNQPELVVFDADRE